MNAADEADRMIKEILAEAWRRFERELSELAPGETMIDLHGLERAQVEATEKPRGGRTEAAIEHYGAALVFAQPALAAQRERPN
jgi:hypothetical protein